MKLKDIEPGKDYVVVRFFRRDMRRYDAWQWPKVMEWGYRATVKATGVERKFMTNERWPRPVTRNDGIKVEYVADMRPSPFEVPPDTVVPGLYVICPWEEFEASYAEFLAGKAASKAAVEESRRARLPVENLPKAYNLLFDVKDAYHGNEEARIALFRAHRAIEEAARALGVPPHHFDRHDAPRDAAGTPQNA
jgi:hypothetical protein